MTLSPEHKAEKIVHDIFLSGSQWGQHDWKMAEQLIAIAIRQACNEKLEEAARMIDDGPLDTKKFMRGEIAPAEFEELAERIREFKDKTP